MLGFTVLVLAIGLLKNEVQCGKFGTDPKTKENLLPKAVSGLPSHWTSNLESPLGNKILVNTTSRIHRSANAASKRQAKFLPKFSILAGLDIGGGFSAGATSNLSSLAKISQASPGIFNPYIAASYDPYPTSAVHQSIQTLFNLVERLREQVDNFNKQTNSTNSLFSSEVINENIVDDRNRRKEKLKTKKSAPKRKKQEQIRIEEEEEDDEDIDDVDEKKSQNVKKGSKNRVKANTHAKQTQQPADGGTSMEANSTVTNSTNTTNQDNNTGWYYGGNPQNIGNVSLTYGRPQETYGAPSFNYGPPSTSYGAPSYNYGGPSLSYGSPSYIYGPPSRGYGAPYEQAHFSAIHDSEPLIYEDPTENIYSPSPSRWYQRLPFARSQNLESKSSVPDINNSNGFVPML